MGFGIACYLRMVSYLEQQEGGKSIAVDITLVPDGRHGAPELKSTYQSALEDLVTYVNQTLAVNAGIGVHVRYWGAWNEPDNTINEPSNVSDPEVLAANYALWAHQVLETHALRTTALGPLLYGLSPLVGTPCESSGDGPCTVIVGDFAAYEPHASPQSINPLEPSSILMYQYQMRYLRQAQDFQPAIWSYHGYDDITTGADAANGESAMIDTTSMDKTFLDGQWNAYGHKPQIWMSEGGDALQNNGAPTADSGAVPAKGASCTTTGYTTALDSNITSAIDRYLALTTGKDSLAGGSSGLTPTELIYAGKVSVALYYDISEGGSGYKGEPLGPCNYPDPVAVPPHTMGGKFDSALFETLHEAKETQPGVTNPVIEPRLQYCLLDKETGAMATTDCPGPSIADPQDLSLPDGSS
jgi:hypothetical protein